MLERVGDEFVKKFNYDDHFRSFLNPPTFLLKISLESAESSKDNFPIFIFHWNLFCFCLKNILTRTSINEFMVTIMSILISKSILSTCYSAQHMDTPVLCAHTCVNCQGLMSATVEEVLDGKSLAKSSKVLTLRGKLQFKRF